MPGTHCSRTHQPMYSTYVTTYTPTSSGVGKNCISMWVLHLSNRETATSHQQNLSRNSKRQLLETTHRYIRSHKYLPYGGFLKDHGIEETARPLCSSHNIEEVLEQICGVGRTSTGLRVELHRKERSVKPSMLCQYRR